MSRRAVCVGSLLLTVGVSTLSCSDDEYQPQNGEGIGGDSSGYSTGGRTFSTAKGSTNSHAGAAGLAGAAGAAGGIPTTNLGLGGQGNSSSPSATGGLGATSSGGTNATGGALPTGGTTTTSATTVNTVGGSGGTATGENSAAGTPGAGGLSAAAGSPWAGGSAGAAAGSPATGGTSAESTTSSDAGGASSEGGAFATGGTSSTSTTAPGFTAEDFQKRFCDKLKKAADDLGYCQDVFTDDTICHGWVKDTYKIECLPKAEEFIDCFEKEESSDQFDCTSTLGIEWLESSPFSCTTAKEAMLKACEG